MVEHQPSKLRVAGSNPVSRSRRCRNKHNGVRCCEAESHVAAAGTVVDCRLSSVVEHFHGKEGVIGSNPIGGSRGSAVPRPENGEIWPQWSVTEFH